MGSGFIFTVALVACLLSSLDFWHSAVSLDAYQFYEKNEYSPACVSSGCLTVISMRFAVAIIIPWQTIANCIQDGGNN